MMMIIMMCAADVAAENFYENMQAANADYENVFTNRSPVKGEPCLHVVTDGMERLGYDHFGCWSPRSCYCFRSRPASVGILRE